MILFSRPRTARRLGVALTLLLFTLPGACLVAQQPDSPNSSGSDLVTSPMEPKPEVGFFGQDQLTGTWGGLRTQLANHGVTFGVIYTGEEFGNPVGGIRQGAVYDGLLELDLDLDFDKLARLPGLKLHASSYELHGPSGTRRYVGDFGVFSNIDFYDSFRLFELWLEEEVTIPHVGKLSLRAGQLASDKEFYGSESSALFINSDFGVLPIISGNVPSPIFAIAAPGVRLRYEPSAALYLQAAVYDGNPDPDSLGDPSPGFRRGTTYNHTGGRVNLNAREGAYSLAELGYRVNQSASSAGLPGAYKIGGFYHTDTFSDQRFDERGLSLADPRSTGRPRARGGDYGGYLVIDQALYRPATLPSAAAKDSPTGKDHVAADAPGSGLGGVLPGVGLAGFLRLGAVPDDRNALSFYLDTGVNYRGILPGREKDLLGLAVSYARFSNAARGFDRDVNFFRGTSSPTRDQEVVFEATYQAALTPWCAVQPDVQAIFHPGGSAAISNALVLGLRTVLTF